MAGTLETHENKKIYFQISTRNRLALEMYRRVTHPRILFAFSQLSSQTPDTGRKRGSAVRFLKTVFKLDDALPALASPCQAVRWLTGTCQLFADYHNASE